MLLDELSQGENLIRFGTLLIHLCVNQRDDPSRALVARYSFLEPLPRTDGAAAQNPTHQFYNNHSNLFFSVQHVLGPVLTNS